MAISTTLYLYQPLTKDTKKGEVEAEQHPRKYGVSKYGAGRFAKGIFDMLTVFFLNTYGRRPLHFIGWLVLGIFFLGSAAGACLTVPLFMGIHIGTRPLLFLSALLMLIGVQIRLFSLRSELQIDLFYRDHAEKSPATVTRNVFPAKQKHRPT